MLQVYPQNHKFWQKTLPVQMIDIHVFSSSYYFLSINSVVNPLLLKNFPDPDKGIHRFREAPVSFGVKILYLNTQNKFRKKRKPYHFRHTAEWHFLEKNILL
jgi:hypothetical protein